MGICSFASIDFYLIFKHLSYHTWPNFALDLPVNAEDKKLDSNY